LEYLEAYVSTEMASKVVDFCLLSISYKVKGYRPLLKSGSRLDYLSNDALTALEAYSSVAAGADY
jgi:hypothetical protein